MNRNFRCKYNQQNARDGNEKRKKEIEDMTEKIQSLDPKKMLNRTKS